MIDGWMNEILYLIQCEFITLNLPKNWV